MLTGLPRLLVTLSVLPFGLQGQFLTLGAIGGTNLTKDTHDGRIVTSAGSATNTNLAASTGHNLILGLSVEYGLPGNWSVEFDALHREVSEGGAFFFTLPDGRILGDPNPGFNVLSTWELPVLAKYRFEGANRNVFVTGGPGFRAVGNGELSHFGGTIGAGVEFRRAGWRFSPTLRYTRWKQAAYDDQQRLGRPQLNQLELLVGLDRPTDGERISAFGAPVSFGFIAGVGLGADFDPGELNGARVPESNSPLYGAAIEARLQGKWALEVDALYRALHGTDNRGGSVARFAHLTWEFPVLLKYQFPAGTKLRPVLEAGPSFRSQGNLNLNDVSKFGATVGAGLERRFGGLRLTPMVRYTRWAEGASTGLGSRTKADQVQILVKVGH